jgi:hypothetical protein
VPDVLDQAAMVRTKALPRVQQLYSGYPHLTNRYLNLMAFARQAMPAQAMAFQARTNLVPADLWTRRSAPTNADTNAPPRRAASS